MTPADPPVTLLELPGGPVAVRDSGQGPALLCLHGLPGSSWDFRWVAGAAGERLRVIRVDRPGFGDSPVESGPGETVADYAALALGVLDHLGLKQAAVMGHSLGGPVALHLAAHHPERVSALALICSPGRVPHQGYRRGRIRAFGGALRRPLLRRALRPLLLPAFRAQGFTRVTEAEALRTLYCASLLDFDAVTEDARRVRAPSLIASTEDDPLIEPAIADGLGELLPPGPRLRWPDGAHNPQKPHAVEIVEALLGILP